MTLTSVKPGDIVEIEKKGRKFLAFVVGKEKQTLEIDPIQSGGGTITWRTATSREVKVHYKKAGRKRNGSE